MSSHLHIETYWDIVWRQFRKNRAAVTSLWLLALLFATAIFAPVVASNLPFVYFTEETTYFPWFRGLFNPEMSVDYFFNMALIAFFPYAAVALGLNVWFKGRGISGKRRLGYVLSLYVGTTLLLALVFSSALPTVGLPSLRPLYPYTETVFRRQEFVAQEKAPPGEAAAEWGLYAPIPFGPTESDLGANNKGPGHQKAADDCRETNDDHTNWLGTDKNGVDVLTQMLYGTRVAMTVGFVAVVIYVTIGVFLGAIAGFFGGKVDMLISRAIEVVLLFPSFFLILTIVGLLGPSIYIIMVVIGLTSWPGIARLVRGEVLKQRAIEYVLAAKAQGISSGRIIFRHVLPNSLSPVLVAIPFGIAGAIITEAGLSLLGWGVRPPAPTWGTLLRQGHANFSYWWLIVVPSVAIFFTVSVFNLVGSGLRDAMDPRLRR